MSKLLVDFANTEAVLPETVVVCDTPRPATYHMKDVTADVPKPMCRSCGHRHNEYAEVDRSEFTGDVTTPCRSCFRAVLNHAAARDDSPVRYDPPPRPAATVGGRGSRPAVRGEAHAVIEHGAEPPEPETRDPPSNGGVCSSCGREYENVLEHLETCSVLAR
jgi:hypothetical protein